MALTVPVLEIVEKSKNLLLSKHKSWKRVLLGEIGRVQNGYAFNSSQFSKDLGVPLIRIRDISKDITEVKYSGDYDSTYIVEPGDLLVGMDGDFNCARWKGPRGLLNQRVCRIKLVSDLYHPKFLEYALPGYLRAINDVTSSVTVKHISSRTIEEIPLPFPPLRNQKSIVAEIEKQFSRLDEAVASLKRVKTNLKRYKAAVLNAAVEGKLTEQWRKDHSDVEPAERLLERILTERRKKWEENELAKMKEKGLEPKDGRWKEKYKEPNPPDYENLPPIPHGWHWTSTDQLFWFVTSGSRGWAKYYSGAGSLFLRVGNLDHDSISLDMRDLQRVTPQKGAEGVRTNVEPNDILISITADVGMIAVIPHKFEEAYINQHISLARPVNCVESSYIAWYLTSRHGQKQFRDLQRGATKAGLGLDDIRSVNIPLPPLEAQKEIVSKIEERLSVAEEITGEVNANLKRAEHLRQSILKKAYSGILVPQDASDGSNTEVRL